MKVENLCLEVTRMCTLECEHCLRGDRRFESMSLETINNIFNGINKINKLVLTGGEPLLAVKQLKEIVHIIKEKSIKIKEIMIITNGTVLSEEILSILEELLIISKLNIAVSYDMFHYLELKRLKLYEERMKNTKILKEKFNAKDYGSLEEPDDKKSLGRVIYPVGRAATLTEERLNEINKMINTKNYLLMNLRSVYGNLSEYNEEKNIIKGFINIDVQGNVTGNDLSFVEEDDLVDKYESNINEIGIIKAVCNHQEYFNEIRKHDIEEHMQKTKKFNESN